MILVLFTFKVDNHFESNPIIFVGSNFASHSRLYCSQQQMIMDSHIYLKYYIMIGWEKVVMFVQI